MAGNEYRTERGDAEADRERVLALWERCGFASGEQARARYDWFYLGNPRGRGRVYLLLHGSELVGAVGAGSRRFARGAGDAPLEAAMLVDFVVHPAHRSMFPALQLQRAAREHELRHGDVVYGLPDVKAAPVFRRLGSTLELASGSHVRVLRSGAFASRLLPRVPGALVRLLCTLADRARLCVPWLACRVAGVRARWQPELPPQLDALWQRAGACAGLATGERDRDFLRWRFCPRRGDWQVVYVTARRGTVCGYFICRREGDELQVFDLLLEQRPSRVLPLLALALAAWRMKAKTVRIAFGGCELMQRTLVRAGYLLRDQRPCFLMRGAGAAAPLLPQKWWLTRADEDV